MAIINFCQIPPQLVSCGPESRERRAFTQIMRLSFFLVLYSSVVYGIVNNTVDLGCNKYQGVSAPNDITKWLGLRYAAPPLDELRFLPPEDPPCNDAVQIVDQVRKASPPFAL